MTDCTTWHSWPAPAKLNLFLHIVGRRHDGYHLLQTVFQLLDWGDRVSLRCREDGQIVRLRGAEGVPASADLVVRAAQALRTASGACLGAEIDVEKHIPQGGGLGGGSSDAATVLLALNHLWQTGLSEDELAEIGLGLGADVPVFVRGRSAFAEGLGEKLTPLDLPARWYLIVHPGVGMATAELFANRELTRNAPSVTIANFISGLVQGNAFEPVLRRRSPEISHCLDVLARFGSPHVTGTGAGLFLIFSGRAEAEAVQAQLPSTWQSWVSQGVNESAMKQALRHARPGRGAGNK